MSDSAVSEKSESEYAILHLIYFSRELEINGAAWDNVSGADFEEIKIDQFGKDEEEEKEVEKNQDFKK